MVNVVEKSRGCADISYQQSFGVITGSVEIMLKKSEGSLEQEK